MAIINVNNPGDIVLDQAPEPQSPGLPPPVADDIPGMPNLMGTVPPPSAQASPAPAAPPAAAAPAPQQPAAAPPPRFTKIDASTPITLDPTPVQASAQNQAQAAPSAPSRFQKLPPGTQIQLDPVAPKSDETYLSAAGKALVRGAIQGSTDVAHAANPFVDRGQPQTDPAMQSAINDSIENDQAAARARLSVGDNEYAPIQPVEDANIAAQQAAARAPYEVSNDPVDQVINGPVWRGDVKNTIGGIAVKAAHSIGENAPSLGLGIAGAVGGGMVGGPVGATVGGAAGFGSGAALQEIAPAYLRARQDGLSHDDAVDRAIKETIVAGGFGVVAALLPETKLFGKSWQMVGAGSDGVAEMVKLARAPVSEALAQTFGIQAAVGAAQQAVDAKIENKPLTASDLASGYVNNAVTGGIITGLHGAKDAILPEKQFVNPTPAPGTRGTRAAQPPIYDADVVGPTPQIEGPIGGWNPKETPDGGSPVAPAPGGGVNVQVDVPLNRDDLANSIKNGTPLPTKKTITLPDVHIDPELQAQGYTVGNKVQQVTDDGEVHEGTIASARQAEDGTEVTMLDDTGNLRTLFSTDGPIVAAKVPPAASQPASQPQAPETPKLTPNGVIARSDNGFAIPPPPSDISAPGASPAPPSAAPRAPRPAPAAPAPKDENLYAQMDLPALKNSLDFVNNHAKSNGGWNKGLTVTKRAITHELDTRFPEWQVPTRTAVASAAADVAQAPTDAQKEAGNYQKGHVSIQGLPVTLETVKGQIRSGVGPDGKPWQVPMPAHYGYIKRTTGADDEHVDVYVGNHPAAKDVYVVDQIDHNANKFDEHKALIGFSSLDEALKTYQQAFSDGNGAARMGGVSTMSVQEFKKWLKKPGARRAPLAFTGGIESAPAPAEKDTSAKIKKNIDDLINITKKDGPLAAEKAFQRKRKNLSESEQEAIRKGFADAYREKGLADAPKTEPVTEENKSPAQQPEPAAETAKNAPEQQPATLKDEYSGFLEGKALNNVPLIKRNLKKELRFSDGKVMSIKDRIDGLQKDGKLEVSSFEEPKIKPLGRREFNNADQRTQDAHERRMRDAGNKTTYLVSGSDLGKTAYDYAKHLLSAKGEKENVQPGRVQPGVPDNDGAAGTGAAPENVEGQKPETSPPAEDAGSGEAVRGERGSSDAAAQNGEGSGVDGGDGSGVPHADTVPESLNKPEAPKEKIDDFGEKLAGAKKDIWKEYKDAFSEDLPTDPSEITLAKHFPEPNYEKLIEDGADIRDIAAVKAMRDMIPAKPRKSWKLKSWGGQVEALRHFSNDILNGKASTDDLVNNMRKTGQVFNDIADKIDLYEQLGYPAFTKASDWRVNKAQYSMYGGETFSPAKTMWSVGKGNSFGTAYETKTAAVDFLRGRLMNEISSGPQPNKVKLEMFRDRNGGVFIGKKLGPGKIIRLKDGFATPKEAREYLKNNEDDLAAELEKRKKSPQERRETNNPRVGEDYRGADDATPEKFAGQFGFRGVQFGNYVEQGKRATDLNDAYDGLKDMASIIGIPPRAISLDGTLGLAFGARGSGGKRSAAAHYEPGNIVINLTKNSGAGSLGHEWFHALDNNFGSRSGDLYKTENTRYTPEVRNEVTDAFKGVVDAIAKTGMRQRSKQLDMTRTKDYWSTIREMGARAFEAYLIHKASEKSESNDYLANIVGHEAWKIMHGEDENTATYPYPTDAEMKDHIAPAFDKLFATMKTQENENGNVAMYSLGNKAADRLQSTLLKTADAMRQGKGTGDQILGYLRKQAGVKEEEISWTGLDDFLKGKTGVTKEDVVNYMNKNQVHIKEVTLSTEDHGNVDKISDNEVAQANMMSERAWDRLSEEEKTILREELIRTYKKDYDVPKFSQYTLPGGENYREVLMTLPKSSDVHKFEVVTKKGDIVGAFDTQKEADDWADSRNRQVRGIGATVRERDRVNPQDFKSSHFDQPNIVAHVRLNDRTDADGKKVLFVEEIQSDWHQKGRKIGYKTGDEQSARKRIHELNHIIADNRGFATTEDKAIAAEKERDELLEQIHGVPDAPFKKTWQEMAFRRVAQMAAHGGYDRVAWTTGEQQNDRFDLSNQIDSIIYKKNEDGTYEIRADKDGKTSFQKDKISEKSLSDTVGKDVAEKIANGEGQPTSWHSYSGAEKEHKKLSGIYLKVGGEGMKGFYDKIIPQYAAKFGKKFGAEVGKTTLPLEYNTGEYVYKGSVPTLDQVKEVHEVSKGRGMELTSPITGKKMEYTLTRVAVENPLRKIVKRMDEGAAFKDAFAKEGTPEIAEIFGGEASDAKKAESAIVHSMDITPAMRESADAGLELFKQKDANLPATQETVRAGDIQAAINEQMKKQGYTGANVKLFSKPEETGITGMDAGAEGVYHNGIIHISMDAADPLKVLDHETIHELKAAGAFTPAEWKTLEAKAGEWRKKYNVDENYADHDLSDRQLNEEGIAHAFQDHTVQGPIRRIINRVLNFFKAIRNFLRGKGFNFKSAEDIFDSVKSGEVSNREEAQRGRQEIKDRAASRAAETAEEDFPKYDLGKAKGPALDEAKESLSKVRGLDRTLVSDIKRVSAAILHPHQIATLYKEFTPVYRAVIQRYKDREVLTHQLSTFIDPYNRLNDEGKKSVDAALEIGRLTGETFKPADDGTITVKNDGLENAVKSKPGDTVTLTPTEAKAYTGVRNMLDTALDKYKETILEEAGLLDKGIKTTQDVEKLRARAVQDGDVDQVKNLKNVLQRLNDVDSAKKKGYVPFKRWGDIGISVKNEDGDTVHFEKVQTSRKDRKKGYIGESKAVQKAIERLTKKYPGDEHAIHAFEMSKFDDVKAHVDLRALDALAHSSDMSHTDYERLRDMLEKEMQKKGYRSHFFKAKDVPGYSDDFERAINDYVVTISSYISRRLNNSKIEGAVANVAETGKSKLHDYAKKYVDYVSTPEEELAQIRMLGFTYYLAGNLSSGISYLTQPFMLTAPWFSAKFGHIEIGKAMTKGYADAIKMINIPKMGANAFDFSKAPADVRDGLIKAQNEGEFMSTGTNDAMAISSTTQSLRGLDKGRRTVSNALGAPFSIAERTNRVVTWISAYRLAMKPGAQDKIRAFIKNDELGKALLRGKNSPEAFAAAYADLAVVSTQFRHGKLNRPQIARGFGSLLFQFQSWTMQALELLYKLNKVNGGKNYKALAAIILSVTALAGVKGLPFEEDAKNLIEALFKFTTKKDIDIETDVRTAIIKYTHSAALAEALIKGVPAALFNVDMSNRLGIGSSAGADLFHGGLGPWADILYKQPAQAAKDASNGEYLQALADVAPQFIHNPLEAYIWSHDGVRTESGNKVIDASKVTGADAGLKAIGFTPSSISDKRDASYAESRANSAVNDLRSSYTSQIAKLIVANAKLYDASGKLLPGATQKDSDQLSSEINAKFDEMNRNNQDEPLYKQVYLTRAAIKQQVLKEMDGSDAMKPRKQAREEVQNIKNTYNAQ